MLFLHRFTNYNAVVSSFNGSMVAYIYVRHSVQHQVWSRDKCRQAIRFDYYTIYIVIRTYILPENRKSSSMVEKYIWADFCTHKSTTERDRIQLQFHDNFLFNTIKFHLINVAIFIICNSPPAIKCGFSLSLPFFLKYPRTFSGRKRKGRKNKKWFDLERWWSLAPKVIVESLSSPVSARYDLAVSRPPNFHNLLSPVL